MSDCFPIIIQKSSFKNHHSMFRFVLLWTAALVCLPVLSSAQTGQPPSDRTQIIIPDSLVFIPDDSSLVTSAADAGSDTSLGLPIVLLPDSTQTTTEADTSSELTAPIQYTADNITYDFNDSTLVLSGHAELQYGSIKLKAGQVRYHTYSEMLTASFLPDTTGFSRGANTEPTLEDSQGTLVGERMQYHLTSQKGRILRGRTKYDEGFFEGQQLRVDDDQTLKIDLGSYSTCDIPEHKHYFLKVKKAKIIPNDKAIVKHVTAYVFKVPVFYLPFYVFPLKQGRRSGFTTPDFGSGEAQGTYFRNLGYYWAASDYWDLKVTTDIEAKTGFLVKPVFTYAQDRRLRGSVRGSYQSEFGLKTTGWDLFATHWQQLQPDFTITGQAQFAQSLKFVQSTTRGVDPSRLQSSLRSTFTANKRWGQNSLNFSVSESSPDGSPIRPTSSLGFRFGTRPIFKPPQTRRTNSMPDFSERSNASEEPAWYHSILFGFDNNLRDQRSSDSTTTQTLTNNFNLSSQQNLFGWLKFQPQSSYSETWNQKTIQGFDRENRYRVGISTNTTLYGLFQPNVGRLTAVRHVVTPRISFTQTGPENVTRSASFSLDNILQAKTEHEDQENKYNLLFVTLSSAYNFKATSRPLSDLSTRIRAPGRRLEVNATLTHDFYDPITAVVQKPWFKRGDVNTSLNLIGPSTGSGSSRSRSYNSSYSGRSSTGAGYDRYDQGFDQVKGPWTLKLTHRYSVARSKPDTTFNTSTHVLSTTSRFNMKTLTDVLHVSNPLTNKWRVQHDFNYDYRRREIVSHSFNFHRTLHCWEFQVRWTRNGINKGLYFRLNIIALPEIKIEQERRSSG
jgi:lipopolysaccharide assembly outer membrane protein LptD (OstA)